MIFQISALQPYVIFARYAGVVLAAGGILCVIISRIRTNRQQVIERDEALRHSAGFAQVAVRELLAVRGRIGAPSSSKSPPRPLISLITSQLSERDAKILQRDLHTLYQAFGRLSNREHFGQLQGMLQYDYIFWAEEIKMTMESILGRVPMFREVGRDDTLEVRALITELAQAVGPLTSEMTSLAEFISTSLLGFFFTL